MARLPWQVWSSWRPRGEPLEYLTQPYGAAQIGAPKPGFRVFARAPSVEWFLVIFVDLDWVWG